MGLDFKAATKAVSTHSRAEAAAVALKSALDPAIVSTHSRAEAAAIAEWLN